MLDYITSITFTMYIYMMKNFKDQNVLRRFIFPALAIIGSIFFTICGTGIFQLITTGEVESLKAFGVFMIFFVLLMLPSIFFYKKEKEMPEESL